MYIKRPLLFTLLLFFITNIVFAQDTALKAPPSFQFKNTLVQKSQIHEIALKQSVAQLRAEDTERIKNGHPLRIAVGIPVDLEFNNKNIQWLSLPTGEKIWQQSIRSEGANGLILSFEQMIIPEGGELFIYTEDRTQLAVFTHETNPTGGLYASDILYQDEVILEYVQSKKSSEDAVIKISDVGHVYRGNDALANDLSCYINLSCEEGNNWQAQKNGVVGMRVYLTGSWYICTGSLINNARNDGTPYVLTANHCIEGADDATYQTMTFNFFKESTSANCTDRSTTSSLTKTLTGATLIADIPVNGASDGTLLKLTSAIPTDWEVYYNGWDARNIAATSGVSIHHPNGMVKKISTFTSSLVSISNIQVDNNIYTGTNTHWRVRWARTVNGQSVTYGGSSGSPLFNADGRIVGTLTGGTSFCNEPNGYDYYGKFSYHWDQYSDPTQHFKNFLDPDNTGVLVLDGYDPNAFEFENVPEAEEATNIAKEGFTANWKSLERATRYFLDVYQKGDDGSIIYLSGYKSKNVGNVNSFSITNLTPETQYYYVVRGGAGLTSVSEASNEISLTTSRFTLDNYSPEATQATDIQSNSFQANWEPLAEATSYNLNVYQKVSKNRSDETIEYVPEYEALHVGNTLSYLVDGLDRNTQYYYTVVASDGIYTSRVSNEISVATNDNNSNITPKDTTNSIVWVDDETIFIRSDSAKTAAIYNLTGQLLFSQAIVQGELTLPRTTFPSGVYFVKLERETYKILIK